MPGLSAVWANEWQYVGKGSAVHVVGRLENEFAGELPTLLPQAESALLRPPINAQDISACQEQQGQAEQRGQPAESPHPRRQRLDASFQKTTKRDPAGDTFVPCDPLYRIPPPCWIRAKRWAPRGRY
jgi:hypothetical protein